jgi:hypothetical protein
MLIVIALNVRTRKAEDEIHAAAGVGGAGDVLAAAAVVMLADAAMSLDNVVALAAIARGSFWLLALGVLLSIPIIAYGSLILTEIIHRAPELLTLGALVLGWIAGEMAVSDPSLSGWMQANAPALAALAPALGAAFVWVAGQDAERRSPRRTTEPTSAIRTAPLRPLSLERLHPAAVEPRPMEDPVCDRAAREQPKQAFASEPTLARAPSRWSEERATEPHRIPALSGWSEERVVLLCLVVLAALAGLTIFVVASLLHGFR